jgi:hypothetical protein
VWEQGKGSSTPITFAPVTPGASSTTLQNAYENGNTITTDVGNGPFDVSGTQAISLDASAASNFTVAGAGLTLATTTSGAVAVTSAGIMDLDAVGALAINSSGGAIGIGTDADSQAINIGTGGARTVTIGQSSGNYALALNANIGNLTLDTGAGGDISLDSGQAGNFTTANGHLTLQASHGSSGGDVNIVGQHGINIDAGAVGAGPTGVQINSSGGALSIGNDANAQAINVGTGAAARTITIGNATGATALDINTGTGGLTVDVPLGGGMSFDAGGASNFSTVQGTVTVSAGHLTVGGDLVLNGDQGVTIDGGTSGTPTGVAINSSGGPLNIGNNANPRAINVGTGAAARTITIGNATGATLIDINTGTGGLTVDTTSGGAISLDSVGAASNFSVTSAALSLKTLTSGALDVTSAGLMDLDAATALSINSSGGAINVGNDAVAQAINVGTGAAARTITIGNATGATALDVNVGTGGVTVDTTSGGAISLDSVGADSNFTATSGNLTLATATSGFVELAPVDGNLVTFRLVKDSATTLAAGDAVVIKANTTGGAASLWLADATDRDFHGIVVSTTTDGSSRYPVAAAPGTIIKVSTNLTLGTVGAAVYLSETAGAVTLTAPTPGAGKRIWRVGFIVTGGAGTTTILLAPQFIGVGA